MIKSASRVEYTKTFVRQLKKSPLAIKEAFRKRRELFIQDPLHPLLNNHSLKGKFAGYRSINITGDWRAIYSEREETEKKVIILEFLGTHSRYTNRNRLR